jgi:hypothetical protein
MKRSSDRYKTVLVVNQQFAILALFVQPEPHFF